MTDRFAYPLTDAQWCSLRALRTINPWHVSQPRPAHQGRYASVFVDVTTGQPGEQIDKLFLIEAGGCVAEVLR